jgi:CheY-like chemotaxis protein
MPGLGETARIVVVDSRKRRREQLVGWLQWLGYRAGGVTRVDELLPVLDDVRPDLVVVTADVPAPSRQRLDATAVKVLDVAIGEGPEALAARIRTALLR